MLAPLWPMAVTRTMLLPSSNVAPTDTDAHVAQLPCDGKDKRSDTTAPFTSTWRGLSPWLSAYRNVRVTGPGLHAESTHSMKSSVPCTNATEPASP